MRDTLDKFLWKVFRRISIMILRGILGYFGEEVGGIWGRFGGKAPKDIILRLKDAILHWKKLFYIQIPSVFMKSL